MKEGNTMKKREIVVLLKYQKSLEDSKHLNMKPHICFDGTILNYSDEFIKELEEKYGKLSEHLDYQANNLYKIKSINCTHPVLFFVDREYCKTHRCALCGKSLDLNDPTILINLKDTIEIEETATSESHYRPLNNFYDVYSYIMQIIESKNDDEEIDFKNYFPNSPINDSFKKMVLKRNINYICLK